MTLDAAIAAALPTLRREAAARQRSRCAVMRKTGLHVTDADGFPQPEWATVHADIALRLGGAANGDSQARTENVGAETETAVRVASFAHGTEVATGDLIEVTAGELVGTVWRIREATPADQQTARRVQVYAVTRPEEWAA